MARPWSIAVIPSKAASHARVFDCRRTMLTGVSIHWTTDARAFVYTDYRDGVTNLRQQSPEGGARRGRSQTTRARSSTPSTFAPEGRLLLANGTTTATWSSSATRAEASRSELLRLRTLW